MAGEYIALRRQRKTAKNPKCSEKNRKCSEPEGVLDPP